MVPGIRERPGVFGWLMISSFDDEGGWTSTGSLTFSRSALIVGVYEDIAKSEMQDPGGGRSF